MRRQAVKLLPHSFKSILKRTLLEARLRRRIYITATLGEAIRYHPISTIRIAPDRIDRMMTSGEELYREYTPGCVVGGDWDERTEPFAESVHYRGLKQHFVDGLPWHETELYQSAVNREPGSYYHGCETVADVEERMAYLDSIYQSMEEHGYLSQRELRRRDNEESSSTPPELQEVRVDIDRHGEPIFDDGRHRFAMAKLLDIDEIPVIIIGRHRAWWEQSGRVVDAANY